MIRSFSLWVKGSPAFLPAADPFLRARVMQTQQVKESALSCGKDMSYHTTTPVRVSVTILYNWWLE